MSVLHSASSPADHEEHKMRYIAKVVFSNETEIISSKKYGWKYFFFFKHKLT